jgi:hypothetical protein
LELNLTLEVNESRFHQVRRASYESFVLGNQSLDGDTRRLAGSLRSGGKGRFGRKVLLPSLREVTGQTLLELSMFSWVGRSVSGVELVPGDFVILSSFHDRAEVIWKKIK